MTSHNSQGKQTLIWSFRTFKERFYGHQSDLRNQTKADSTTLSKFVGNARDKEEPEIRWSKLLSAKTYSSGGQNCPLCLAEKTPIATDTSGKMLNRRRELMNRCLHKDPFKLSNFCTSQSRLTLEQMMKTSPQYFMSSLSTWLTRSLQISNLTSLQPNLMRIPY